MWRRNARWMLGAILLWPAAASAQITPTYNFVASTVISPDEVNANFALLGNALNRTGGTMTGTLTSRDLVPSTTATYDIGVTGTRYRDGWLSRNLGIGGTLTVTGTSAFTGLLSGVAAAFSSTLNVTGGVVLSNTLNVGTTLSVGGNATITGNLGTNNSLSVASSGSFGAGITATTGVFSTSLSAPTLTLGTSGGQLRLTATTDAAVIAIGSTLSLTDWATATKGLSINLSTGEGTWSAGVTLAGAQKYIPAAGVTVSTATTIYTAAQQHAADVGVWMIVSGTKVGDATIQFTDLVCFISNTSPGTLVTGLSKGAADTRTYTTSGLNMQLAMGANSYKVYAYPIVVGTPGS